MHTFGEGGHVHMEGWSVGAWGGDGVSIYP